MISVPFYICGKTFCLCSGSAWATMVESFFRKLVEGCVAGINIQGRFFGCVSGRNINIHVFTFGGCRQVFFFLR